MSSVDVVYYPFIRSLRAYSRWTTLLVKHVILRVNQNSGPQILWVYRRLFFNPRGIRKIFSHFSLEKVYKVK